MPSKKPAPKKTGRPKGKVPPRTNKTVRLDLASLEWIDANVPRGVSLSSFVNDAVREKIARETGSSR